MDAIGIPGLITTPSSGIASCTIVLSTSTTGIIIMYGIGWRYIIEIIGAVMVIVGTR
jgi:hypothetical protein